MFANLLILLLTLSCFTARFHCALEEGGFLSECCEGTAHNAPGSANECDGCPDFESSSTVIARKAPGLDAGPYLFNHWATRQLLVDVLNGHPTASPGLVPTNAPPLVLMGPRDALDSLTTSLRGPPVLA